MILAGARSSSMGSNSGAEFYYDLFGLINEYASWKSVDTGVYGDLRDRCTARDLELDLGSTPEFAHGRGST